MDESIVITKSGSGSSAVLMQGYPSRGLYIGGGGMFMLPRLVGLARSLEIAAFDELIPAEKALGWGLAAKMDRYDPDYHGMITKRLHDLYEERKNCPSLNRSIFAWMGRRFPWKPTPSPSRTAIRKPL